MNLLEYEAKKILTKADIPTPKSHLIKSDADTDTFTPPVVLKSQVPVGGRGKLGGVRIIDDAVKLDSIVDELFSLPIKGHLPKVILAEEKLDIAREFYLSLTINREDAIIELVAHYEGGVEIESHEIAGFFRHAMTHKNSEAVGEQLAEYYSLESHSFALQDLIKHLYDCFVKNDATLLEINPLILTKQGKLVAGDCKMTLDDAARFRHPEWHFEATQHDANFVTLDNDGSIATIANGAGLAMATVDAVVAGDMRPANFLDIGGGASEATVLQAFEQIMTFPNIQAIVINIFAGITRCDEVARAIVAAQKKIDQLPPLFIRLAGTNYEEAAAILAAENIPLLPTLEECIAKAKEVTHE